MSWRNGGSRNGGTRPPLGEPTLLNYAIVSGKLTAPPRSGEGARGGVAILLALLVPVLNPEQPREVVTWTDLDVEVPDLIAARHRVRALDPDQFVLAAGQVSERSTARNGVRHNVLLAEIVHPQPPDPPSLVLVGGPPNVGPTRPSKRNNGRAQRGRARA